MLADLVCLQEQFALVVGGSYQEAYLALSFCLTKFVHQYSTHTWKRFFAISRPTTLIDILVTPALTGCTVSLVQRR